MKKLISQDRLKELLAYDHTTGVFIWRVTRCGLAKKGKAAGWLYKDGYTGISIDFQDYRAHHLAWLYVYGYLPDFIDHINGRRSDNRIENLREATPELNQQNRKGAQANNRCGLLGVCWHKENKRWRATIRVSGKKLHIGYFPTANEAHAAYLKAKAELHPFQTIAEVA